MGFRFVMMDSEGYETLFYKSFRTLKAAENASKRFEPDKFSFQFLQVIG